jgi:type I restriction enzyme M protein
MAMTTDRTSKAELSALVDRARKIMRKDAGLSGDLDRIPQLAWLLFLKAFDDLESRREITERKFRPALQAPYRWRDWAADPIGGRTGDSLLGFVNDELLPYLRGLRGSGERDPRDVVAAVFKETFNRMLSGYLLRDVVDLVNRIDFASADDIHTMAHLYETMLRELRDAAGDAGEFYTPRPVIRFIAQQTGLRIGDRILDPAAGTGGFLVEALEEVRPQALTVEAWRTLQENLIGVEKKPMPYLLGTMNPLLHGIEQPRIRRDNALATPLHQLPQSAKVDVVLTNPPFGGEEEKGIESNFPDATRTAETALLFLQFIQRALRPRGRCGMVVPDGVLFGDGVAARIKERLLRECSLHTIVRLPPGVFAPYTLITTNLIFFEKTGPTKEIWFYEHPLPPGRKNYTKTNPLKFEEFAPLQEWWGKRVENEHAWRVPIGEIGPDFNLDLRHPQRQVVEADRDPAALVATAAASVRRADELARQVERAVARDGGGDLWPEVPLRELVTLRGGGTPAKTNAAYWEGEFPWVSPKDMKTREIFDSIDHISSEATTNTAAKAIDPGAVLVVVRGMILAHTVPAAVLRVPAAINQDMKALVPDQRLSPEYLCLALWARNRHLVALVERSTHGTRKLGTDRLLDFAIPLPPREEQEGIVAHLHELEAALREQVDEFSRLADDARAALDGVVPAVLARHFRTHT